MSRSDKIIIRIKNKPKDFSWSELQQLMSLFGYEELNGRGSRKKFFHPQSKKILAMHKRHPDDTLLPYQINDVISFLEI